MNIYFSKLFIPSTTIYKNNTLPDINNVAYIHAKYKTSYSCQANLPEYFGDGMVDSMLPYLQISEYSSNLKNKFIKTIVIENDYLKATILPNYGGRLCSLYDKKDKRELLYKNEVFKICNLSLLNAWFSGGVEWNVSIKGHNPLTCSKMFASIIKIGNDSALRLYEYERKREISYSIDFYLPNESKFLIVIPRIENTKSTDVYNYWWSNIAVPENKNTRVIVPANKSYVSSYNKNEYFIDYLDVPFAFNRDTSYPTSSPCSNDYFYDIPQDEEKWISAIDENGKGLIQCSTKLLKGRKLFVWGNSEGGTNWQNLLSNNKKHYIEIQAGLLKTQLQHFPLKANSKVEWVEAYGPISIDKEIVSSNDYSKPINACKNSLLNEFKNGPDKDLSKYLMLKTETVKIINFGSSYGYFKNKCNEIEGIKPISSFLEFPINKKENDLSLYQQLLDKGYISEISTKNRIEAYDISDFIRNKLVESLKHNKGNNWTAYYLLGVSYHGAKDYKNAFNSFSKSFEMKKNAYSARALSMYYKTIFKDFDKCYLYITTAFKLNPTLELAKDLAATLIYIERYDELINLYDSLDNKFKSNDRLKYYKAYALSKTKRFKEASKIINYDFSMHDVREGELSISNLWYEIYSNLLIPNVNELTDDEKIAFIDKNMPLKHLDFRMHK